MALLVAVKFCGGCDPAYDRIDLWERLNAAAPDNIDFMLSGDRRPQALLLICGCETACPLREVSGSIPVFLIDRDVENIEVLFMELTRKGERHGTYRYQG